MNMPIYTYDCPNGHATDHLVKSLDVAPPSLACERCQAPAARRTVYRTQVIGPVWSDLDKYTTAFKPRNDDGTARQVRDARDVADLEASMGLRRLEASEQRQANSDMDDMVATHQRLEREGGVAAVDAYERQEEIRHAVPTLTNAGYVHWRDATDAVNAKFASGELTVADIVDVEPDPHAGTGLGDVG